MLPRLLVLTGAAGLVACGSAPEVAQLKDAVQRTVDNAPPAAVAFRFGGRQGADVRLYRLPGLDDVAWQFETPGLMAQHVVGFAEDDDLVWVVDPDGNLIALDLNTGRARTADSTVAAAVLGPSGIPLYARRDSGLAQIPGRNPEVVLAAFREPVNRVAGMVRGRLLVVVDEADTRELLVVERGSGEVVRRPLPAGPVAISPWGEVIAVGADSGVVVVDPLRHSDDLFTRLPAPARDVVFSPSAHRIFVSTEAGEVLEIERFGLDLVRRLPASAAVGRLRVDPLGRVLLAEDRDTDRLWIIRLVGAPTPPTAVVGRWGDDLPTIAPDGTLLVRQGEDVVAIALTGEYAEEARVQGGAADRWLVAPWDPRRPELQLADEQARAAAGPRGAARVFVQVSSTTNLSWAEDLARDLRVAGLRSAVLAPEPGDQMYRVVVGPFETREEADEAGRQLGMPYWIFTQAPPDAPGAP